jgi:hypothetical protein
MNPDTPYVGMVLDVSEGPVVIELPAGASVGAVNDLHQRCVMDIGLSGPDHGRSSPRRCSPGALGAGSLYWLSARDSTGAYLDGGRTYKLSVPLPLPDKLFWSITVYDAQTRTEIVTDQRQAALRSLVELTPEVLGDAGHAELYFSPEQPPDTPGRWDQDRPRRGWFVYFASTTPTPQPSTAPGSYPTSSSRADPGHCRFGRQPRSRWRDAPGVNLAVLFGRGRDLLCNRRGCSEHTGHFPPLRGREQRRCYSSRARRAMPG